MPGTKYASNADRIHRNVAIDARGCWNWQLAVSANGYGQVCLSLGSRGKRRVALVHRLSYETFVAPIPDGLHIDHLCRNRKCCNPEHLEPVTPRENVLRSPLTVATVNAQRTKCKSGHPFDEQNTGTRTDGRYCRSCHRATQRAYEMRRTLRAAGIAVAA